MPAWDPTTMLTATSTTLSPGHRAYQPQRHYPESVDCRRAGADESPRVRQPALSLQTLIGCRDLDVDRVGAETARRFGPSADRMVDDEVVGP